uniref:Uncharacterized protein n=1 Tax=Anguilla anguilla TaxID=7936 RepID=A0A0E9W5A3_ANGAN
MLFRQNPNRGILGVIRFPLTNKMYTLHSAKLLVSP